jgi:hypothetical protein
MASICGMLAAYGSLMTPTVQSMVAATYVRDIGTSRAFYELLGFHEQSAGTAATSAWSSLHHDELSGYRRRRPARAGR